jgi:AraC-like DNA-binding protein
MKIMHEQVDLPGGSPLKVKYDDFAHFSFPWNYHGEFEIVYVIKSYGTRFVGDHVGEFTDGDLVLLGSNVPHLWKNAPEFYAEDTPLRVNAIVVQFPKDFMEGMVNAHPEFRNIRDLFFRADRGVRFTGRDATLLGEQLKLLLAAKGLERLLMFIRILEQMALARGYQLLASEVYRTKMPIGKEERLGKILNYIQLNYQSETSVDAMAKKFGMNTAAFCRYFKESTSKSVVQYTNEMRVGYACKLLMDKAMTISEICFECGFNNISNFNRIFKRINGCSPSAYRVRVVGKKSDR